MKSSCEQTYCINSNTSKDKSSLMSYENYLYSVELISIEKAKGIEEANKKHQRIFYALLVLFLTTVSIGLMISNGWYVLFIAITQLILLIFFKSRHIQLYESKLIAHGIGLAECCTQEVSKETYNLINGITHRMLKAKIQEVMQIRNGKFLSVDADSLRLDWYFEIKQNKSEDISKPIIMQLTKVKNGS